MKLPLFKLLIILALLSVSRGLKAQAAFVPGFLVTAKGDTLKGELKINPKKLHENHYKIIFKDSKGSQKNYKPGKAKAYGYADNLYISFDEDEEPGFYKVLTKGSIVLLQSSFEVINKNELGYENEYFLYKEGDKKITTVKEGKFKKQLHDWMADAPEIAEEFKDEKKFNVESAVEVINKYNDWKKQH